MPAAVAKQGHNRMWLPLLVARSATRTGRARVRSDRKALTPLQSAHRGGERGIT